MFVLLTLSITWDKQQKDSAVFVTDLENITVTIRGLRRAISIIAITPMLSHNVNVTVTLYSLWTITMTYVL